jgi:hypothetical protein
MPSAEALKDGFARDRGVRHGTYGKPVKINGVPGTAIYGGIHYTGPLTEGGFKTDSDATIRLQKADWPTLTSAQLVSKAKIELPLGTGGAWLLYMVSANARVTDSQQSGEWIMHLDYLQSV